MNEVIPYSGKNIDGNLEKQKKKLALPGIEPGLARPQRDVIPLDHSTLAC